MNNIAPAQRPVRKVTATVVAEYEDGAVETFRLGPLTRTPDTARRVVPKDPEVHFERTTEYAEKTDWGIGMLTIDKALWHDLTLTVTGRIAAETGEAYATITRTEAPQAAS